MKITTPYKVEFSIPEKYTNVIELGSRQTFTVPSDNEIHSATVVAKDASLNQNTRTLLVRAVTPNFDGKLLAGQSARLSLSLSTSGTALVVTSQALIPSSTGYSCACRPIKIVWSRPPVEIGQRGAGSVEVVKV
ncbi:MAG: hypothetical protein WDN75_06750 [Bacteroidota bacterium]